MHEYLAIESEGVPENRLLPGASPVMAFVLKGSLHIPEACITRNLPPAVVSRLRKSPRLMPYDQVSAAGLVRFGETEAVISTLYGNTSNPDE